MLSFGVGTKFLEAKRPESLRDMHAEVLARRGLLRFLHQEMLLCLQADSSRLLERSGAWCKLRESVTLHFYTSSVPCGNASWKRWAKGHRAAPERHPRIHLHARHEGQAAFLVKSEGREPLGDAFGAPVGTAIDGPGPLSCSAKLCQWAALGLGGRQMAMPSLRLKSCTVGRKFSWPHAARALCCRLQDFHQKKCEARS